jgi:serine/threonine protein kinase
MKFELQEHLGKYPIVKQIGSGATSRVYLARDPFADRDVAIKVFLFDENVNPQTERMMHKAFLAEAALAGKLSHPHIVEILDAVVEPEHSYLVMEYLLDHARGTGRHQSAAAQRHRRNQPARALSTRSNTG